MSAKPFQVLILDPQTPEQLSFLQGLAGPLGIELSAPGSDSPAELQKLLPQAEGVIVQRRPLTAEMIAQAPGLRVIQKMGGRRDKIDIHAAAGRGIVVALMPLPGAVAVAEHALALVLACAKQLIPAHHLTVSGAYRQFGIEPKTTSERSHGFQWMKIANLVELSGLTMGIFGFGDIGNEIARRARVFEMEVLYHKRERLEAGLEAELGVKYASKEELLRQSDFVVMTSPLTPETEKTIGAPELAMMKASAILINVSRGGVIDEEALVKALRERQIAAAGLDVFVQEPLPFDHPFVELDNVVMTPHIAGGKGGARERQPLAVLKNLQRFAGGEPLLYRVL